MKSLQWSSFLSYIEKNYFKKVFGLDPRSIAFFRVFISAILIFDLFDRSLSMTAHYTDQGIFPRKTALETFWNEYWFSLYMISGGRLVTGILFFINFLVLFCLMIGYKTQLSLFLSWIFLLSIHSRFGLMIHGGDLLLRCLLLWSLMGIPLGKSFSIDRYKKLVRDSTRQFISLKSKSVLNEKSSNNSQNISSGSIAKVTKVDSVSFTVENYTLIEETTNSSKSNNSQYGQSDQDYTETIFNISCIAIVFQMFYLYFVSYFYKTGDEWRKEDSVVIYVSHLLYFQLWPLGSLLANGPENVLRFLSWFTLQWEYWGPLLFLSIPYYFPLKLSVISILFPYQSSMSTSKIVTQIELLNFFQFFDPKLNLSNHHGSPSSSSSSSSTSWSIQEIWWRARLILIWISKWIFQPYSRLFVSLGMIFFHIGMGIHIRLGTFLWAGIVGNVILIPQIFWSNLIFPILSHLIYPSTTSTSKIKYSLFSFSSIIHKLSCIFEKDSKDRSHIYVLYYSHCEISKHLCCLFQTFFFLPSISVQPFEYKLQSSSSSFLDQDQQLEEEEEDYSWAQKNQEKPNNVPCILIFKSNTQNSTRGSMLYDQEELGNKEEENVSKRYDRISYPYYLMRDYTLNNNGDSIMELSNVSILSLFPFSFQVRIHNLINFFYEHNEMYEYDINNNNNNNIPKFNRTKRKSIFKRTFKFIRTLFVMFLIVLLTVENWKDFDSFSNSISSERTVMMIKESLQFSQSWAMFAPSPSRYNWWWTFEAHLENSSSIDLFPHSDYVYFQNTKVRFLGVHKKPDPFAAAFGDNQRWYEYFEKGLNNPMFNGKLFNDISIWICTQWNEKYAHDTVPPIDYLIYYYNEEHLLYDWENHVMTSEKLETQKVWTQTCS